MRARGARSRGPSCRRQPSPSQLYVGSPFLGPSAAGPSPATPHELAKSLPGLPRDGRGPDPGPVPQPKPYRTHRPDGRVRHRGGPAAGGVVKGPRREWMGGPSRSWRSMPRPTTCQTAGPFLLEFLNMFPPGRVCTDVRTRWLRRKGPCSAILRTTLRCPGLRRGRLSRTTTRRSRTIRTWTGSCGSPRPTAGCGTARRTSSVLRCAEPKVSFPVLLEALGTRSVPVIVVSPRRDTETVVEVFRGRGWLSSRGTTAPTCCPRRSWRRPSGNTYLSPSACAALREGSPADSPRPTTRWNGCGPCSRRASSRVPNGARTFLFFSLLLAMGPLRP
ncbi:hypothetical protein SALBM311S_12966 [Streptomyces alboniger]